MKLNEYTFSYEYNGKQYGFNVPAYSAEEAQAKVKAMRNATYDGQIVMQINTGSFWQRLFGVNNG